LQNRFDKQREEVEKQRTAIQKLSSNKEIAKPSIPQSNYSTKAAKK
jgi:hypothetical protein